MFTKHLICDMGTYRLQIRYQREPDATAHDASAMDATAHVYACKSAN